MVVTLDVPFASVDNLVDDFNQQGREVFILLQVFGHHTQHFQFFKYSFQLLTYLLGRPFVKHFKVFAQVGEVLYIIICFLCAISQANFEPTPRFCLFGKSFLPDTHNFMRLCALEVLAQ